MNVLDLFSGVGAFSIGLERAGMRTTAFCEIDPFRRRVLAKNWPGVPIFNDVRTLTADRLAADGIAADVICGGFPCQDISNANAVWGANSGLDGERSGLWFEYLRLIGEVRPRFVIVENVRALLIRGLGTVLGGLAGIGYNAEWRRIPASDVGAPHFRDRLWIVAYPSEAGAAGLVESLDFSEVGPWWVRSQENLQALCDNPFEPGDSWPQPLLRRMDDGLANRSHRVAACGDTIVPRIPEIIGRAIMRASAFAPALRSTPPADGNRT